MQIEDERADDETPSRERPGDDGEASVLLRRHVAGDSGAFARLVAGYRAPVYGYLCRCGVEPADRDDLFQEVFIKIHRAAASYEPSRPAHPWIFTVVANTVRNHLRRRRLSKLVLVSGETAAREPADTSADSARQAEAREAARLVDRELAGLKPVQRQVVLLAGVEKLTMAEVARALDLPVGTVKTHLRRARLALARALVRHGFGGAS